MTGAHFALGSVSLTCHPPYFHIYILALSYLWHFRQSIMGVSAEMTSWMKCNIYSSGD